LLDLDVILNNEEPVEVLQFVHLSCTCTTKLFTSWHKWKAWRIFMILKSIIKPMTSLPSSLTIVRLFVLAFLPVQTHRPDISIKVYWCPSSWEAKKQAKSPYRANRSKNV